MRNNALIRPVFLFLFLVLISNYAFTGTLDPNFGTGGKFIIAFHDFSGFYRSYGQKIFVQPSNRIIGAGAFTNNGPDGQVPGFAMVGLIPSGTLDTSFGNNAVFKDWTATAATGFSDGVM